MGLSCTRRWGPSLSRVRALHSSAGSSADHFQPRRQNRSIQHMEIERARALWFAREAYPYGIQNTMLIPITWLNPSAELPYHGAAHLLRVAGLCMLFQRDTALVPVQQMPALIAAALWHDVNHQRSPDDQVNVDAAVQAYLDCTHVQWADHRDQHGELTVQLIRATQFPHRSASSIAELVIQDADLLMSAEPDAELWRQALEEEAGTPALSAERWYALHPPHTRWARDRVAAALRVQELR
jgi:hypothetical protein